MQSNSLIVIFIVTCCICEYTLVEIMPEFKRSILNFVYGIYVVTKFILPSINDLHFPLIDFNEKCSSLDQDLHGHHNAKHYVSNPKIYCEKIVSFIEFYKKQISSYNCTAHYILKK